MKHVIIIEDDTQLSELMKELINDLEGFSCELTFENPVAYLNAPVEADIFLLDVLMPEMNGLDAIIPILKLYPNAGIIMNTIKDDSETIFEALQRGAIGYIDKQSFEMKFKEVFISIANGGAYMTPKIARKIIGFFHEPVKLKKKLTQRETDIVNGILDGLSYKLIGDRHGIALDTVRMNIKKVYKKLNINSKSELFELMSYTNNMR
jgi:DNA-binding NarL/FixJ family response regulator